MINKMYACPNPSYFNEDVGYNSSSNWSFNYEANSAVEGTWWYWCSAPNPELPVFWWIYFKAHPVEILSIKFEEEYPGAPFEFYASSGFKTCAEDGRLLISITTKLDGWMHFENGQAYHCYFLKITKLVSHEDYYLASIKNFSFQDKDDCINVTCSGNRRCQDGINQYSCICNAGFTGNDCETEINQCDGQTCSGHGTCVKGMNDYSCTCSDGYTGKDCETIQVGGSIKPNTDLRLTMEYRASSEYDNDNDKYAAKSAEIGGSTYWCSKKGSEAPQYWRMLFKQRPVQIVSIGFEERHEGAEFQFFASNDVENCDPETYLINGTREKIDGELFENKESYFCYGLKVASYRTYATVKNFNFNYRGSFQRGSNSKMENSASSVYRNLDKYAANQAIVEGKYYCSEKNAGLPVYWWMSFEESPVEIVSIKFEEKDRYKGARFEFFACDAKELCKEGRVLIKGTQKEISGKEFYNGQNYHSYGLKITKLGANQYVSLMNFQYFVLETKMRN